MPDTTVQPNESVRIPTGDQIMSAAREVIADEFPNAAPTASAHANKLANRLCHLLSGGE